MGQHFTEDEERIEDMLDIDVCADMVPVELIPYHEMNEILLRERDAATTDI